MSTVDVPPPYSPPNAEPPNAARTRWRTLALAGIILFLVASSFLHYSGRAAERSDDAERLLIESYAHARQLYLGRSAGLSAFAGGSSSGHELVAEMSRLVEIDPEPTSVRRLALAEYMVGDARWRTTLLRLRDLRGDRRPVDVDQELGMWRAALEGRPTTLQAAGYARAIRSMQLGWYQHVALEALYQHAGEPELAAAERGAATRSTLMLFGLAGVAVLVGLAGVLIGFVAALVAWANGGIRRFIALRPLTTAQADGLYIVFVVYLGSMALLRFLVSEVFQDAFHNLVGELSATGSLALSMALSLVALVPAWIVFLRQRVARRVTAADVGLRSTNAPLDVAWGFGGYALSLPLVVVANLVSTWLLHRVRSPSHPVITEFTMQHGLLFQVLVFAQVAILPPIIEETMFRGVLFRALSPRLGTAVGMLLTAGIFAVLHPQLPLGFLGLFALGLIFNTLYLLRGSLLPSMVAHGLNNGLIFLYFTLLTSS